MNKTYPEMNEAIVGILRMGGQSEQYAAQYIEELQAENAAMRERIENAVERLKAREQSVCFGLGEWKAVVTDKDIDEVFGVTESSLEDPEGGK